MTRKKLNKMDLVNIELLKLIGEIKITRLDAKTSMRKRMSSLFKLAKMDILRFEFTEDDSVIFSMV